jgi:large subunit ribosomal protein L15
MPLHRRLPKRGFNNIFAKRYNELNLGRIQAAVDSGQLDGKKPITVEALKEAGLIRRTKDGVRLLGHGELKAKLAFEVTGASGSAIKAVEAAGGTVTLKSITGREAPAADAIKAKKRAEKRAAAAAPAKGKAKAAKAEEGEQPAEGEAKASKPAKAKAAPEAAAKAPKKAKADEAEDKKPKAKPQADKKDKS